MKILNVSFHIIYKSVDSMQLSEKVGVGMKATLIIAVKLLCCRVPRSRKEVNELNLEHEMLMTTK